MMEPEDVLRQIESEMREMMLKYQTPVDHHQEATRTAKVIQGMICESLDLPLDEVRVDFELGENSCDFNVQTGKENDNDS